MDTIGLILLRLNKAVLGLDFRVVQSFQRVFMGQVLNYPPVTDELLEEVVRRTVASECPYDTACFHAQQAMEKYLKEFLARKAYWLESIFLLGAV